jgi:hypothetical protein
MGAVRPYDRPDRDQEVLVTTRLSAVSAVALATFSLVAALAVAGTLPSESVELAVTASESSPEGLTRSHDEGANIKLTGSAGG